MAETFHARFPVSRSSVYSDSYENSVPVVNIVDDVNIFQKQTTMSKTRSSGINDSDGSKKFVEYSNLNLLRWFIVLRQRSHVRSGVLVYSTH